MNFVVIWQFSINQNSWMSPKHCQTKSLGSFWHAESVMGDVMCVSSVYDNSCAYMQVCQIRLALYIYICTREKLESLPLSKFLLQLILCFCTYEYCEWGHAHAMPARVSGKGDLNCDDEKRKLMFLHPINFYCEINNGSPRDKPSLDYRVTKRCCKFFFQNFETA